MDHTQERSRFIPDWSCELYKFYKEIMYFGVYELHKITSAAINAYWTSIWFDMGDPTLIKGTHVGHY